MSIGKAILLIAIGITLCACTPGVGQAESKTMATAGVSRVEFESIGDLEIAQGDQETIRIEADPAVLRHIETEVRGDTLVIGVDNSFWRSGLIARPIRYRLTARTLEHIALTGAGNVHVATLEASQLTLELTGTGTIAVDALAADELLLRHRGAGTAIVGGRVDTQKALIAGAGSYQAEELASRSARVEIIGAGDATVWAEEHLEARIQGVGSIRYYGDPLLDQEITGVGQVKGLGAR